MNKVSVIIPFYNAQETILRTLQSVLEQTYEDIEVILINDGSSDSSVQLIESLKNNSIKLFSIENRGPGYARVEGLKHSTGEYVFFLDADDILCPSAIEELFNSLEAHKADVAIAKYETFSDEIKDFEGQVKSEFLNHNELIQEISSCHRIQNFLWGKLFRKNVLNTEDFDTKKRLGEDISTLIRVFHRCNSGVYLSEKALVYYYQNPKSLSRRLSYSKLNDYCDALIEKVSFIKENYNQFYKLLFHSLIDYVLLIVVNYDANRIRNFNFIKRLSKETSTSIRDKLMLFVSKHPSIAKKLVKERKQLEISNEPKIAVINTYNRMSTGNVAKSISDGVSDKYQSKLFYGRCYDRFDNDSRYIGGSRLYNFINNIFVKITGKTGGFHKRSTKRLIKEIEKFKPNIIHLHNIHGNFLNYRMLFEYLKDKKVVVTAHDCFWLTGRCAHFLDYGIECNGWKSGCIKCPHKNLYMGTLLFDHAEKEFKLKQAFVHNAKSLVFVVLSSWQEQLYKRFNTRLIPNGFDYDFETDSKQKISNINLPIRIVGVSQNWTLSKGINEFNKLANDLDPNSYQITLIGRKAKGTKINKNINFVGPLNNKDTLKTIRDCDLFVNPTYADTFPTVLIESLSVGTPVVSYDVGGCKDIVGKCGYLVSKGSYNELKQSIESFKRDDFNSNELIEWAKQFSRHKMINEYLKLYNEVINGEK